MIRPLLFFAIFIVFVSGTNAQITISSLYKSYYDDNIFNNYTKVSDFINSATMGAGYNFETGNNNLQLYYMGNMNYYQKNIYKSSMTHKYGLVDTYLISEDENPLNIGVNYSFKKNRDDFILFNYDIFSLYANYMHNFNEQSILLAGYIFNKNRFENYSMFSHDENKLFLKYTKSFETGTTVILGIEYDNKNYINPAEESSGSQKISQMKYYLHSSQSLDEKNGIGFHALLRKNLNSGTRFITSGEYIYYEEEIFNDNYSNDGYEIGLNYTHLFTPSFKGMAGLTYQTRKFSNLPVVDESGYETSEFRSDKQFFAEVRLSTELGRFVNGLYASLSLLYINNNSNDYFYKFNNTVYSIGFGWEF